MSFNVGDKVIRKNVKGEKKVYIIETITDDWRENSKHKIVYATKVDGKGYIIKRTDTLTKI